MTRPLWTNNEWTFDLLKDTWTEIEKIGVGEMGLNLYPNQFEIISSEQMLDAYSSIGLPVYYKHWSFGKRHAHDSESYKTGASGLAFEIVINSNPCINYLMEDNTMTTQALVMAHAGVGHNWFFKNNYMFKDWTDASSIVDYLIFAKDYIEKVEQREGTQTVERFLDSCHALSEHGVNRYKHPTKLSMEKEKSRLREREEYIQSQVDDMYKILPKKKKADDNLKIFPEQPEENILYFCEKYAPNLEPWQREIIRIVRKISQYLYPQGLTKTINEGTASFIHHTIMNRMHDKGLITDGAYLEFISLHASVIYQPPWKHKYYSGINPYKLGFEILKDVERICNSPTPEDKEWFPNLIGQNSLEQITNIVENYRDESFVRQFLSPKIIRDLRLFHLSDDRTNTESYSVDHIHNQQGYQNIRENLANQYEREQYVPRIEVIKLSKHDKTLHLMHTEINGKKLSDPKKMLYHLRLLWTNNVVLYDQKENVIAKA